MLSLRSTIFAVVFVTAGQLSALAQSPFRVHELRLARVTLFELGGPNSSIPPEDTFHGHRIKNEWALGDTEVRQFLALLEDAQVRAIKEAEELEASGKIGGGVVGCISYPFAARFRLPDDRVEDAFITIECQRVFPAKKGGRVLLNLDADEAEALRHFIWVSEPRD